MSYNWSTIGPTVHRLHSLLAHSVCRVERYVYVQQSKHKSVCISLLCLSTISLSYVCVQHVVDRCVCSVERYMYVQQSKHMCVCISLLCLLYLCHMCVRSTMSTGAIYISHVSYTSSTHESCLFETTRVVLEDAINIYIIIYVLYESCLLYTYR